MNTVIRNISIVPTELIDNCLLEISTIDWKNPEFPDRRNLAPVFKTSHAIHLRVHDSTNNNHHASLTPAENIAAYSAIIACIDTPMRQKLPATDALLLWVYTSVNGRSLGRIMLVNLLAGGNVGSHIDPGIYFETYKRFHVPLISNEQVVFTGSEDGQNYHMPTGVLGQLNNGKLHGIQNNSKFDRIHLIADIATDSQEFKF